MGAKESKILPKSTNNETPLDLQLPDYYIPDFGTSFSPEEEETECAESTREESPQVSSLLSPQPYDDHYGEVSPRSYILEDPLEINSRIQASIYERTVRYIEEISEELEPIVTTYKYDTSSISSLIEIFSFCDCQTQNHIKLSCKYFSKITDVSRKIVDIKIKPGWLNILKNSIFVEKLTIRGDIAPSDCHGLSTLIRIEGYPFLSSVKLVYIPDVAIAEILRSLEARFGCVKPRTIPNSIPAVHSAVFYNKRSNSSSPHLLDLSRPPANSHDNIVILNEINNKDTNSPFCFLSPRDTSEGLPLSHTPLLQPSTTQSTPIMSPLYTFSTENTPNPSILTMQSPTLSPLPPLTLSGITPLSYNTPSKTQTHIVLRTPSPCFQAHKSHPSAPLAPLASLPCGSPPPILSLENTYKPISLNIRTKEMGSLIPFVLAEVLKKSFRKYLQKLTLCTYDKEGLESFLKRVSFVGCEVLDDICLDTCPLGRRSCDYLIRSLWPEDAPIVSYPPIRHLSLSGTQLVDGSAFAFSLILSKHALSNLESLDLSQNNISKQGLDVIIPELCNYACPNLKILNLSNNKLGEGSLKDLFYGMSTGIFPLLEKLFIENTDIGEPDMLALSTYIESDFSQSLIVLDASSNPNTLSFLPTLFNSFKAHSFPSLSSLSFDSMGISQNEIDSLCSLITDTQIPSLSALSLKGNNLNTPCFIRLLAAQVSPSSPLLQTLIIANNQIGSTPLENIQMPVSSVRIPLKKIELSYNLFNDEDFDYFISFMNIYCDLTGVTSISIDNNHITAAGLALFAYFSTHLPQGNIRRLDFSNNRLHGGIPAVFKILSTPLCVHLEYLSLCECDLSENDIITLLKGFAAGLGSTIISLKLNGNHRFTTNCLKLLVYLWRQNPSMFSRLMSLSICYTSVSEQGALLIGDFLKNTPTRLRVLDMDHINIHGTRRKEVRQIVRDMWKTGYVYI
ncbi:hypothetical protein WA158_001986 [Blastocystis sp. Blastoise]